MEFSIVINLGLAIGVLAIVAFQQRGVNRASDKASKENATLRREMSEGNATLRRDLSEGNDKLRKDLTEGNATLRRDLSEGNAALRREMSEGNAELRREAREDHARLSGELGKLRDHATTEFARLWDALRGLGERLARIEGRLEVQAPPESSATNVEPPQPLEGSPDDASD